MKEDILRRYVTVEDMENQKNHVAKRLDVSFHHAILAMKEYNTQVLRDIKKEIERKFIDYDVSIRYKDGFNGCLKEVESVIDKYNEQKKIDNPTG